MPVDGDADRRAVLVPCWYCGIWIGRQWHWRFVTFVPLHCSAFSVTVAPVLMLSRRRSSSPARRGIAPAGARAATCLLARLWVCTLWAGSLLLAGLFAPTAAAIEADWVLSADVPLVSRAPADQKLALQEGMRRVLVRMAGRTTFGTSVPLARAFAQPHLYAKQITAVPISGGEALRVTFNEAALKSLLETMGMTFWPKARPQVVVWAASGGETDARLTTGGPFMSALQAAAKVRGLPMVIPRIDSVDRELVTGTDVLSRIVAPAVQASVRYEGEMVLVGSWRETGGGRGTGSWALVGAAGSVPFSAISESPTRHAEAVVDWVVGVASGRLGAAGGFLGSGQPVRIAVTDIVTLDDYMSAMAALSKLTEVSSVRFDGYSGTEMTLTVTPKTSYAAMLRMLSAASSFNVDLSAGLVAGSQSELRLRWLARRAP